ERDWLGGPVTAAVLARRGNRVDAGVGELRWLVRRVVEGRGGGVRLGRRRGRDVVIESDRRGSRLDVRRRGLGRCRRRLWLRPARDLEVVGRRGRRLVSDWCG